MAEAHKILRLLRLTEYRHDAVAALLLTLLCGHAAGEAVREYINGTVPLMAFGEYWDTCEYTDGVLNYNQDAHRQRTVNWCDKTGGTAAAFDFTTKGTLPC